ncbi:hypothetical protein DL93DRAFT_2171833 [Clavulina sp. PMI_390]|nr:hypothetical protein DL93DRAFT_2171833 [Clavulina sp. PMI_390]
MRFERPDKIAALTLAVPFLAIGWRSQVDLHDFVSHRMNTTIELPGKIRDMSFAETTLIVLHSDPPLITAFPLQYDAGGSMRPPKGITVDVPMSKHVGTTNKGVPLRFTTPSSNITCDDGAFVFLDGRGVLGDKFSRCIISLSWKHGQQDEISITCSPWSEPAIFDHTLFASSSKLRSRSTTTTSAVQAPSHQPTAGSIMNRSLQPSTSPVPPLLPLSAKISASSICAGSHHIISCIMATHGQRAAPLVHTRMLADGSLVTKRLHLSEKTELLFGEDFSGASAPMAWDELSGRLFIVRSDWGDDWLVRDTLTVLQL